MSRIASQFAIGVQQAMTALGVPATYVSADGENSVEIAVILAAPEYQVSDDASVVMVAVNRWDVLLVASALLFNSVVYEPQPGDTIVIGDVTYLVTVDEVRRYCWTWADKFQLRRRVFTKIVSEP